jgi:hypothetical protein
MFQTQKKKEQGALDVAISGKIKTNLMYQDFMHLNNFKLISNSRHFLFVFNPKRCGGGGGGWNPPHRVQILLVFLQF